MSYLVPDNFLEMYICSECHKYLSVKPVKVYPNRKIKCGRCAKIDDDGCGAYSLLEKFEKIALFKCVNRFDGCRALLNFDQVADHENKCLSKNFECPICTESTLIPTFDLLRHFKQHHVENILKKRQLNFDTEEPLIFKKIFLYKKKDHLFLIFVQSHNTFEIFSLEMVSLGAEGNSNICSRIYLHYNNVVIEVIKEVFHGKKNNTFFKKNNLKFFRFDLDIDESIGKIATYEKMEDNRNKTANILLQREWIKSITLKNAVPFCFLCSEIIKCYNFFYFERLIQYVCEFCEIYIKNIFGLDLTKKNIPYNAILYFCTWNCKTAFSQTELYFHEIFCSLQPKQECPVESCNYKGKLREIDIHFGAVHKNNAISLYFNKSTIDLKDIKVNCSFFWINGFFVLLEIKKCRSGFCIHTVQLKLFKKPSEKFNVGWFYLCQNGKRLVPNEEKDSHNICSNVTTILKIYIGVES